MRAPLRALALAVSFASAGCHANDRTGADAALAVGPLYVGEPEARAVRDLGAGTPGRWRDEGGTMRAVRIYRSGDALLGLAFASERVVDIEAFADGARYAHGVFAYTDSSVAPIAGEPVAAYAWLGRPIFSNDVPPTPPGWHLPTDFTVAQQDVPFLIASDDRAHLASKARSRTFGWIVSLH